MVIMMNKNILISICLLLISMVGVGCVSAADTNATDINDMGQMTVDQQVAPNDGVSQQANSNAFVVVPKEVTDREHSFENHQIKNDTKEVTVVNSTQNNTINNTNKNNNTDANKPKLDIKGPKINSTPLNIKGPKGPINIEPSQKTKDIFRIAKYFEENSWINLRHSVIDAYELTAGSHYTLWEIAEIAARAHNIALHKHPDYCWGYGEVTVSQAFEIIKHETWYYFKPRE